MKEENELNITKGLANELENNQLNNKINNLINFKQIVDNFLAREELSEAQKERVSDKMKNIVELYLKIVKINKMHRKNSEKAEKIKAVMESLTKKEIVGVVSEMEMVDEEIKILDAQIEEAIEIANQKHKTIVNDAKEQINTTLEEYAQSVQSTVTIQKSTKENVFQEEKRASETKALTVTKAKKEGFFSKIKKKIDKVADAVMEDTASWNAVYTEKEGKQTITYVDMQTDQVKAEYELTGDEKEDKKREEQCKSVFTRIKKAFGKEEKKISYSEREKNKAIEEQIKGISKIADKGISDYADQRYKEIMGKAKGIIEVAFRDSVEKLRENYVWADKLSNVLQKQEDKINKEINVLKESMVSEDLVKRLEKLQKNRELAAQLVDRILEKMEIATSAERQSLTKDLIVAEKYYDRVAGEYIKENGLKDLAVSYSISNDEKIRTMRKKEKVIKGIKAGVDKVGTKLKNIGTKEKKETKKSRAEEAAKER